MRCGRRSPLSCCISGTSETASSVGVEPPRSSPPGSRFACCTTLRAPLVPVRPVPLLRDRARGDAHLTAWIAAARSPPRRWYRLQRPAIPLPPGVLHAGRVDVAASRHPGPSCSPVDGWCGSARSWRSAPLSPWRSASGCATPRSLHRSRPRASAWRSCLARRIGSARAAPAAALRGSRQPCLLPGPLVADEPRRRDRRRDGRTDGLRCWAAPWRDCSSARRPCG